MLVTYNVSYLTNHIKNYYRFTYLFAKEPNRKNLNFF